MLKKLFIDGTDLSEFGIVPSGEGTYNAAERDLEVISVEGRNGDLVIDKGRYHNIPVKYPISIARNFPYNAAALRDFLGSLRGYVRIEDEYHPDFFRMGYLAGSLDFAVGHLHRFGEAALNFNCKPQRFLIDGEGTYAFLKPSSIFNHTNETALPLITVYGNGAGELSVGGVTVSILALEDQLTLDCEIQNAYRKVGDAPPENKNGEISAPVFPSLNPGVNGVSWTGGITRVEIIPRWWTL